MWCKSCRVTGYTHCAHPDECGNMVTLTAAADSWKSWLDDAPLPETFNSATGGLQDFITALSRALLTARAELDTTQTQLGDWIVRADEANVKVETLDAELARVRADAQAAVALMVERAVAQCTEHDDISHNDFGDGWRMCASSIASAIRALAPADGLAAVKALRVEARENAMQALASMGQAQEAYEAQLEAEAELARVKADAAAAQALVVEQCAKGADRRYAAGDMGNPGHHIRALAPADGLAMVQELRAEMDSLAYSMGRAASERDTLAAENASLKAREKVDANLLLAAYKGLLVLHRMLSKSGLSVGAETATYITDQIAAAHPEMPGLASLRAAPTDPGDGWTWNERLGWIGPDGKPADPRRRG